MKKVTIPVYYLILLLLSVVSCKKEVSETSLEDPSVQAFDAGLNDNIVKAFKTPEGGFILIGHTYFAGRGLDAFVMRIDNKGHLHGKEYFGGKGNDIVHNATCDDVGNILAVGSTASNELFLADSSFSSQYYMLYLDNKGGLKWQMAYGNLLAPFTLSNHKRHWANTDEAFSVVANADGSFWVGGSSRSYWADTIHPAPNGVNTSSRCATIFRINPSKQITNIRPYFLYSNSGYINNSGGVNLLKMANGNLCLNVALSVLGHSQNVTAKILKLNPDGDSLKAFHSNTFQNAFHYAHNLIEKPDGSIAYINALSGKIVFLDDQLNLGSTVDFNPFTKLNGFMISKAIATKDAIYLAGSETPFPITNDIFAIPSFQNSYPILIKTDLNGKILWTKNLNPMNGIARDVIEDGNKIHLFLTGKSKDMKTTKIYLITLNKNGEIE